MPRDLYHRSAVKPIDLLLKRAICHLPMTAAEHDTANNQTLDVSGNGYHFAFGDGSTENSFPTKLEGIGYSFNVAGEDIDYLKRDMFWNPNADFTVCCHINTTSGNTQYVWSHRDGTGDGVYQASVSGTNSWMVYAGETDVENSTDFTNATYFYVADVSGDLVQYVNGASTVGTTDISAETIDVDEPGIVIGRRNDDTTGRFIGQIYAFTVFDFVMSPAEIVLWDAWAKARV